jgi:hypothetical protein
MSAYRKWGVDLSIDLEHNMLSSAPSPDPTAKDARGWCKLELRPDGSLWAVDVRWTPDGIARLSEKRQRYVSPAFEIDETSSRVTKMINVAITAIPATHDTPALVAASYGAGCMDPKIVQQALEALKSGDTQAASDLLEQLIVAAASGDPDANTEDAPPPAGDGGADEMMESAAPPPPADQPANDQKKPMPQAAAFLAAGHYACAITGKTNPGEAMAELSRRSEIAVGLEAREAKLASDRAALEASERKALVAQLVKLGVEVPATAWSDDKAITPCARLQSEPIDDLRKRVAVLSNAKGAGKDKKAPVVQPSATNNYGLTPEQMKICKETNCDPATFARLSVKPKG